MSTKIKLIILLMLLIIASLIYGGLHYSNKQQQSLTLYGNVDIRTVNLSFRVPGRLSTLDVDEGDTITNGQLLATLDDATYKNALLKAQANLNAVQAQLDLLQAGTRSEVIEQAKDAVNQAQAAYDYAQAFYQRQQRLWTSKSISENSLDDAKKARNQALAILNTTQQQLRQYINGNRPEEIQHAKANLEQAKAVLKQAELDVADTRLYSPSAGTVLTRAIEPGSMLSPNTTVVTLSLTKPVWVRAYIAEEQFHLAVPGTKLAIYTDSRPDKPYQGTIGFVSPTAEFTPKTVQTPELRTSLVYRMRIIVSDPDDGLRQGMPVTIHFPTP